MLTQVSLRVAVISVYRIRLPFEGVLHFLFDATEDALGCLLGDGRRSVVKTFAVGKSSTAQIAVPNHPLQPNPGVFQTSTLL